MLNPPSPSNMTRRKFLALSGLAALSACGLASCAKPHGEENAASPETDFDDNGESDSGLSDAERIEAAASGIIAGMTLEQKVAQLFITTPEALTGFGQVTQFGETSKACLSEHNVGGLIYFGHNLENADQTKEMLGATQDYAEETGMPPLFLCVDEEGGTVSRIGGTEGFDVENVGDMSKVGAEGDAAKAQEVAEEIAGYLRPLGFNTDFAPVADVVGGKASYMEKRSFGSDAKAVAKMVAAQVEGFNKEGICCCAKHFPGIGSCSDDSHAGKITYNATLEDLEKGDLLPFQAAIDAGVQFVMVGHINLPNISSEDIPSSLNSEIVQGILRDRMGFEGIVITDDLEMGAVADYYSASERAVMAINAGCDIPLVQTSFADAYQGLLDAVSKGDISEERIDESLMRILRTKLEWMPDGFSSDVASTLA